ncbi:MAG: acyl-CoA dehydrogenase family protein [Acidimicrobiales bacterium]
MQLDFTSEQDELRASVRAVLEKECPPAAVRGIVETGDFGPADALWRTLADLDWPALTVAEEYGGLGLGFVELAVVVEELGRVIAPGPFLATLTQFLPVVREAATPEQAGVWLKAIAGGEVTGTLARAGARARPEGDGLVLTGQAAYVVEAGGVDEYAVTGRLGDEVVVAVISAGDVTIEPIVPFDRSRRIGTVRVDEVRVPADRVLRHADEALARALEEATVAQAVDMVGACQTIFDTTLEYAKARHQFAAPIGSFQAVKHKLANMYVALERARATCYFAAACIAEADDRRSLAASMAKAAAGDCQRLVAGDGIQLLGGIGYTWEHDQHLYVKRAKAGEILFGSAAEHRARIASALGL